MEEFLSPVFNIECEDEEDHDVQPEVQEIKSPKFDHLHKLLSDRSLSLPRHNSNAILKKLKAIAEDNLLKKDLKETCCSLPGNPRSTFLMVFSSDGSKVASSHGDHNINVTDLRTNKCISTLSGHPRTPWCIAFHPHRNDILASGCLGGQVRVWDLHGGSEMWSVTATEVTTVIASLAFHPSERLLVIATNSTLYFWDWNIPQPFAKCSTANEKQKLRYVSFDPLGNWLLTGISNTPASVHFPVTGATSMPHLSAPSTIGAAQAHIGDPVTYRVERNEQERERNLQSRYQTLLDQYERLRVRYQELRHRAAELELNASTSQSTGTFNEAAAVEPSTSRSSPSVDSSLMSASSSDRFWQTLMNAAENLRALSNIGRSLNNPPQSMSGGESSTSRQAGPSLDQDARMRIQLLSRHIENMQRICRSHLEMTRHRRQVYRLQQIRRILEDLREQIRYLQVCVRDSLDLVSRMRTSPSPQAGTSNNSGSSLPSVERPSQPVAANHANLRVDLQFNTGGRIALESRLYSPVQCRRFANYLVGRLCRIGLQHHREHSRLRRNFVAGRDARHSYRRFSLRPQGVSPSSFNPVDHVDHVDSYPGTSRDFPLGIDEDLELDEAPTLERRFNPGNLMGWRRARSTRMGRRYMSRSNSLLHVRCLGVQRRKASLLSRISYGRTLQSQMRSVANRMPTAAVDAASTSVPQSSHDSGQRPGDQSLRPLMERLESHFRLQRQTMGILAQLNEAAATSTSTNEIASSSMTGSREGAASASASFSDSGVSSRPWASNVLHSIRHWRARRDAFERTRSLESRSSTGSSDRFQPPRRMDGGVNIGGPSRYRVVRTLEEDDSSDTDTDMAAESTSSANRWRQSSPIRSPRGVEQRMRLLWREYLS